MSGPVDVRTVLDDRASYLRDESYDYTADELIRVRDAVAELIEADKSYDMAFAALEEYYRQVAENGYAVARQFHARKLSAAFVAADTRRLMALQRVGGAQ